MDDKPPGSRRKRKFEKDYLERHVVWLVKECCFTEEQELILRMMVRGFPNIQIADKVGVSLTTVNRRISEIRDKISLACET